jgi:hypothetical protein
MRAIIVSLFVQHSDGRHAVEPTEETLLRGEPTTIQISRVKRFRIDFSSEVQDGQSLLIGCIPAYEQKEFLYLLLTARNLRLSAEETN